MMTIITINAYEHWVGVWVGGPCGGILRITSLSLQEAKLMETQ